MSFAPTAEQQAALHALGLTEIHCVFVARELCDVMAIADGEECSVAIWVVGHFLSPPLIAREAPVLENEISIGVPRVHLKGVRCDHVFVTCGQG